MPKLTKEELKNLKYVSMVDYCKRVKNFEDMNDKLRFTTQYLLLHGTNGEPDYSLEEATYIAQLAIGTASIIEKEKMQAHKNPFLQANPQIVNPHVESAEHDLGHELFMNDPCKFLKGYAEKNIRSIEDQESEMPDDIRFKNNCQDLINRKLDPVDFTPRVYRLVSKNNPIGIRVRMEIEAGGKEQLDQLYKATKPGFFSRMFNTSSIAAQNLDTVYQAFNNPNHVLYGDKDSLEKAANEYLMHKFPGWQPGDELPEIPNSFDATEKARSTFSINLIKSIDAQNRFENQLHELVDATRQKDIEFADADRPPLNQEEFRDHMIHDLDESNDELIDDDEAEEVMDKDLDKNDLMKNVEVDK